METSSLFYIKLNSYKTKRFVIVNMTKSFQLYANNYTRAYANTYFEYLPKEIIDIIHEYNADHRPIYNKVLGELTLNVLSRKVLKNELEVKLMNRHLDILFQRVDDHDLMLSRISQYLDNMEARARPVSEANISD